MESVFSFSFSLPPYISLLLLISSPKVCVILCLQHETDQEKSEKWFIYKKKPHNDGTLSLSLSLWQQFPCTDVWFSHYHIKCPHIFSPESLRTYFSFTPWCYDRIFIFCCFVSSPGTVEYLPKREEMVSPELHEVLCHQQGWNHQVYMYIKQVSTGIYRCRWVYKSKYRCYPISSCVRVS